MQFQPIRTEREYQESLCAIEGLMFAEPDTKEGDALDALVTLVESYERKAYPISSPDPIDWLQTAQLAERHALSQDDAPELTDAVLAQARPARDVLHELFPAAMAIHSEKSFSHISP